MNKKLVITVLVTAAGLLAQPPGSRGRMGMGPGPGGPMGPGGPGMGRTVTGAPYSAVEVRTEQQALAGGNTIQRQTQTVIHRDSQGRVRTETETTQPGQSAVKRISIFDPVAGMMHELDPQDKTARSIATRRPGGPGAFGMRPNPNSPTPRARSNAPVDPNVKTEDLGTQSINGILATGTRTTRTVPAGAIGNALPIESIHERWVSTELGVPVLIKTTDPRHGTTTTQLTNINRSEPDAALFTVPSDFTATRSGPLGRGPAGAGRPRDPIR